MGDELIRASRDNNLDEVRRLLTEERVDVNYKSRVRMCNEIGCNYLLLNVCVLLCRMDIPR